MATAESTPAESERANLAEEKNGYRFYDEPLQRLLAAMDQGICPWHNPCLALPIANAKSGLPYRGFNQLYLSLVTMSEGYRSPYWISFKQTGDLGGRVKKGARSSMVVYRKIFDSQKKEDATTSTVSTARPTPAPTGVKPVEQENSRRFSKLFFHRIFNYDQTEGADIKREPHPTIRRTLTPSEADERAKMILANFVGGPAVTNDQSIVESRAGGYSPAHDKIVMRPPEDYPSAGEYWGTLFHELAHACCSDKRLGFNKGKPQAKFGDPDYALEELTAEISANLLLVKAGLENEELRNNSAAYLRSWKAKITKEPKVLIWASQRAARVVNMILGVTPEPETETAKLDGSLPGPATEAEPTEPSIG